MKSEVTEKEETIKMKTAKLGALFVVFVMAFTAVAASYAHWEETITIDGIMKTDNIDVYFEEGCWNTNDPQYDANKHDIDPTGVRTDPNSCGFWDETGWHGDADVTPERRDKDVGWCDLSLGKNDNFLKIEIGDAYPCYYAHPQFCIRNRGSCPVQVYGVQLLEVSEGNHKITLDRPITLEVCTTWYVKVYKDDAGEWAAKVRKDVNNPDDYDFSIHLTGDDLTPGTQLDPISWDSEETWHIDCDYYVGRLYGDLNIHFENGCEQLTKYDFQIAITFYNWPELPEP